jgi:predicted CopG family antitoxin
MTAIQINLPDALAKDVEAAGLLSAEELERIFAEALREHHARRMLETMEAIAADPAVAPMSPEEVAEEIRQMRRERRARQEQRA